MMQKNYRDFTVGELLDMGLNVEVFTHDTKTIEESKKITSMFEGTKQSSDHIAHFMIVKGWKGKFEVKCYVK